MQYYSTLKAKLIYIFTIEDAAHRGCVKIGEATLDEATDSTLLPNCKELNAAAKKRINQYTKTAGIDYTLRHTELTLAIHGGTITTFNDKQVHEILLRSGVKRHDFSSKNQGREWFECSVDTALAAIKAAKEGRFSIRAEEMVPIDESIEFRPEQKEAIAKTVKKFSTGGKVMLWNAKMRFGKTLTALQVVKEMRFHRTIIITHRPVVDKGWFEDFYKIFNMMDGYTYGSREKGEPFELLEKFAKKNPEAHYVYFASMQDLRGAEMAGGKFDKNQAILKADYDLVIIDEAHEGTQTELGQNVIKLLTKEKTKVLNLSGTPFNLLDDYKEDEIYTWDYVMEQRAKAEWDLNHFGDPNPYAGLPRLNIFTFDLGKALSGFEDIEDSAFNFKEFFRTWTGDPERDHRAMPEGSEGKFIHEEHVQAFLDLIVKYDPESNYPYSTVEFRNSFRHTLWMVPGVKEARALSAMLKAHPIFSQFEIVNVAGDGDLEEENDDALNMVEKAMGDNPEETRTITLSCGKLTTGVTVKPWTAVMMLAGSHNTDAKAYMQTIFRVQSPYTTLDGRRKENCYVFDFAPDRTLKVLADTAKVQTKKTTSESDRVKLGEFLNFCPVIGYNGTRMATYNVENMLEQLKRAYISRVTRNGCDDPRLYNQEMLRKLDADALAKFKNLHAIIGATKANHTSTDVDMAKSGLTNEQYEELERIQKKPKKERTPEELAALEEAKEKKKNADSAISILRGISIRLPLLMYGAELTTDEQEVTLENFASLIDDQSWEEFMPRGVTKELFAEFVPYYDPDMFRAVSRNYRDLVRAADHMAPLERTREIARIFSYFRNPDKETVLTPWRVVNMHIGDCIGGQVFFDTDMQTEGVKPRFVDHGEVTTKVFKDPNTRILEINSKTGLYPLFMAYSVFAEKLQAYRDSHMLATDVPVSTQNQIWDEVLRNHIFVICKTEMAKSITRRTLRGFRTAKVNARYFEDLINKFMHQPQLFMDKVVAGKLYWKNLEIEDKMRFSAIVSNPPYQLITAKKETENGQKRSASIFHYFQMVADKISDYNSFIYPGKRWIHRSGKGMAEFGLNQINDPHLSRMEFFADSTMIFSEVGIADGITILLKDMSKKTQGFEYRYVDRETDIEVHADNPGEQLFVINPLDRVIVDRILKGISDNHFAILHDSVLSQKLFSIESDFVEKNPDKVRPLDSGDFDKTTEIKLFTNDKAGKSGRAKWYITKRSVITTAEDVLNKWKVVVSSANAGGQKRDSQIEVLDNYSAFGRARVALKVFDTEKEAKNFLKYATSELVRFAFLLTDEALTSLALMVPDIKDYTDGNGIIDFSRNVDEQLYSLFGISKEGIRHIQQTLIEKSKTIIQESLFNDDSLIDPQFGTFDLLEYGVNIGNTITYTPTGTDVIVLGPNTVEVEGEEMTLAQFTAKYMPRNKRSVSGVCQGPKYFSFKGVSLYKMKESFLGGQK